VYHDVGFEFVFFWGQRKALCGFIRVLSGVLRLGYSPSFR